MSYIWRIPEDLKMELQEMAKKMGIPLNSLLNLICREYLRKEFDDYNIMGGMKK